MKRLAVLLLILLLVPLTANADFCAYFLDVGQGDCSIVTCDGHAMIIDGGLPSVSQFVYSFLKNTLHIDRLDYVIATHPHSDHVGGLSAALNACEVGTVYSPVLFYNDPSFLTLREQLVARNMSFTLPIPSNTVALGGATVEFLAPSQLHAGMNDCSIVLKVTYGSTSFLFTGDAELEEEKELLASGFDLSANVLKVGHHGSNTSTSQEFLNAVNPSISVISCGRGNKHGHPAQSTLYFLQEQGCSLFRTDIYGTIIITSDGTQLLVSPERIVLDSEEVYISPGTPVADRSTPIESSVTGSDIPADDEIMIEIPAEYYVGNSKSHKFHLPECGGAQTMNEKNRVIFLSREDAIANGYAPCGTCNP